ncbi:hypothetical protein HK096_003766 [Nowakowskiella sp. JEL0078]|nr:hypothetical protein HK096_003766 [Nowakowskiella sp. JEL0078]
MYQKDQSIDFDKEYRDIESTRADLSSKVEEFLEITGELGQFVGSGMNGDETRIDNSKKLKYFIERLGAVRDSLSASYLQTPNDDFMESASQQMGPNTKSKTFVPLKIRVAPKPQNFTQISLTRPKTGEISEFHGENVNLGPVLNSISISKTPNFVLNERTWKALQDFESKKEPEKICGSKSVGIQTSPLPFGPSTTSNYLLSEVRPWGKAAQCLPKKGLGLYVTQPQIPAIPAKDRN